MKYEYINEIEVPFEEKTFILPQDRIALFKNLVANYKVFLPGLKCIYAFLNFNSQNAIDYLIIFEGYTKDSGQKIILWDCPYLYSNKTVPAYRYIVRNNLHSQFFKFASESLCRMEYGKFLELIPSDMCNLSLDPNSSLYWKNPDNADQLVKAMMGISMEYTPKPGAPGVRIRFHKKDLKENTDGPGPSSTTPLAEGPN